MERHTGILVPFFSGTSPQRIPWGQRKEVVVGARYEEVREQNDTRDATFCFLEKCQFWHINCILTQSK